MNTHSHTMNRMAASLLTALLAGGSLSSCCSLEQEVHRLHVVEPVTFTMVSDEKDGLSVPMHIVPGKQDELVAKILQLRSIEREAQRELGPGATVSFTPGHAYSLCCVMREGISKQHPRSFIMRRKTWVGNTTVYEFDARDYFTAASWDEVQRKLYDAEAERDIEERFGDLKGEALPPAP